MSETDNYMILYNFGLVKIGWANSHLPTQFKNNSVLTLIIDEKSHFLLFWPLLAFNSLYWPFWPFLAFNEFFEPKDIFLGKN